MTGRGADRRSLSQLGGRIVARGETRLAELLASAWRSASGESRVLTHGFHAYPARSPPQLVRTMVAALSRPGDLVVDPFCGSGTTLVEAFAAGRRAFGCDVNGVAVRLARLKTARTSVPARAALVGAAERIARRGSVAARQHDVDSPDEAPAELRAWFAPHVWRELDALGRAVDEVGDPERHSELLLVLSSLLTKLSLKRAETSEERAPKRIAAGFAARLFAERTRELVAGLAALAAAAPAGTPQPLVALADARAAPLRSGVARLVVTSPPYLGTYDYSEIHALRARLLSIPLAASQRREIGARSAANEAPARAIARFRGDLAASLLEIGRLLAPDGTAVIVLGDSRAGRRAVDAEDLVQESAREAGLSIVAAAAQEREGPRREHLIALRPMRA